MLTSSIRTSKNLARAVLHISLCACALPFAYAQATRFSPSETASAVTIHDAPGSQSDSQPITPQGRPPWFAHSNVGGTSLVGGLFSSALGTALDSPSEYGPHWDGFGKRYGMRLTGVSTGNAMEATLGAAWGEDPRYFPAIHSPFGSRVKNIVDLTFRAYHPDGERHLAYARYAATFGNNALSNSWRAQSEADWQHALVRTAEGFGARALSNTFREFFPQAIRKLRHKPDPE